MDGFGWGDPIESPIRLSYRRKGERLEHEFSGPVAVIGEDRNKLAWLKRDELPLDGDRLDLTKVPVIGIGGKRRHQPARVQAFLADKPDFEGAFLLYPGSGQWDLGEGMLFVTSHEILEGKRVSGGRPVVELVDFRWLRDGRYVADRARTLHGKVLEIVEPELEQEPGPKLIAERLIGGGYLELPVYGPLQELVRELSALEHRRRLSEGGESRYASELVKSELVQRFETLGVKRLAQIPEDFVLTAAEVAPDLVARAHELGVEEIPGVGRKELQDAWGENRCRASVELSPEEVRRVTDWLFSDLDLKIEGMDRIRWFFSDPIFSEGEGRWPAIREALAKRWLEHERANRPKDESVPSPLEADPPVLPEPVIWGHDLLTGEPFTAYAALIHEVVGVKGRIVDRGWFIRWFDDPDPATEADAEARREAESYITARRLEAELTAEAEEAELPVALPPPFAAPEPGLHEVMLRLGFAPDQFRIEGEGPRYETKSRFVGSRRLPMDRWGDTRDSTFEDVYESYTVSYWWARDDEVIVVFANTTITDLVGDRYSRGTAGELEVSQETIESVRDWLAEVLAEAQADYRTQVRQFVEDLRAQPAYICISSEMQNKLADLGRSDWGTPDLTKVVAELRLEWTKAEALLHRQEAGEALANFGGHFRVMGRTGNQQYWVVRPDGSEREPDEVSYRKRYTSEGVKRWRVVGPEELALSWGKSSSAASHHFEIAHLPVGGCTPEQLAVVAKLESEIEEDWEGARGLASGEPSPPIGRGWGIPGTPRDPADGDPDPVGETIESDEDETGLPDLETGLEMLKEKWNNH